MQQTISSTEAIVPSESSSSAVSWAAIIAGAVAASSLTLLLIVLGSGLGLSSVSPWSGSGVSMTTFAVSTAIWLIIVQWFSSAFGGYIAGRLRTKWSGVHDDEIYFRDSAHGFLSWALATLVVAGVMGSALTSVVGGGVQAASTVVSGATSAAGAGASAASQSGMASQANDMTSYFVDSLFRPADPAAANAQGAEGNAAAAGQATRILLSSAASGEVSAEDRTYLAQLVAARAGISQADAEARVDGVLKRIETAKTDAKQAADTARKAAATFSLVTALSLLLGAFIASVAALIGGRGRDENPDVMIVR
ncbi:hypothetical protein [Mesorhizobium sp. YR577]|uniref:hypothetical protein n=1 Tax=Mesorhizobium sp. YR577 TaxID=1884373 RepID=UPI0008E44FBA|nr:hypothetical protein [Mesorhizobium sp. YR577]SFT46298.1 hypothetical protein SAMN05518861_101391 [Mesorhizobium sp. YR577]